MDHCKPSLRHCNALRLFLTGFFQLLSPYTLSKYPWYCLCTWQGKKSNEESIRKKSRESSSTTTVKWLFLSGFHKSSLDLDFKSYEVLRLGKTASTNWIKCDFSQIHETDLVQVTLKRFSPEHGSQLLPKTHYTSKWPVLFHSEKLRLLYEIFPKPLYSIEQGYCISM